MKEFIPLENSVICRGDDNDKKKSIGRVYSVARKLFLTRFIVLASVIFSVLASHLNAQEELLLRTLEEHTDPVASVSFCQDGKYIASGNNDDTIKLWLVAAVANGKSGRIIKFVVDIHIKGSKDALYDGMKILLRDISTGKEHTAIYERGCDTTFLLLPEGKYEIIEIDGKYYYPSRMVDASYEWAPHIIQILPNKEEIEITLRAFHYVEGKLDTNLPSLVKQLVFIGEETNREYKYSFQDGPFKIKMLSDTYLVKFLTNVEYTLNPSEKVFLDDNKTAAKIYIYENKAVALSATFFGKIKGTVLFSQDASTGIRNRQRLLVGEILNLRNRTTGRHCRVKIKEGNQFSEVLPSGTYDVINVGAFSQDEISPKTITIETTENILNVRITPRLNVCRKLKIKLTAKPNFELISTGYWDRDRRANYNYWVANGTLKIASIEKQIHFENSVMRTEDTAEFEFENIDPGIYYVYCEATANRNTSGLEGYPPVVTRQLKFVGDKKIKVFPVPLIEKHFRLVFRE